MDQCDPYRTCETSRVTRTVEGCCCHAVVLEHTPFIGRQADRGTIASLDRSIVHGVDVVTLSEEGEIVHWCMDRGRARLEVGAAVRSLVSWPSRFSGMQANAASALVHAVARDRIGEDFPAAVIPGESGVARAVWGGRGTSLDENGVSAAVDAANALIMGGGEILTVAVPRADAIATFPGFYDERMAGTARVQIPSFGDLTAGPMTGLLPRRLEELGELSCRGTHRVDDRLYVSFAIAAPDPVGALTAS